MPRIVSLLLSLLLMLPIALPDGVRAQGKDIAFGTINADRDQPIEVSADNLAVDQDAGVATYSGNVLTRQGGTRLAAPRIRVVFPADGGKIERIEAAGGVTLVSGADAAESRQAVYSVATGMIDMRGAVLLVQGDDVITGEHLVVNTRAGTARISGRVRTILQPRN